MKRVMRGQVPAPQLKRVISLFDKTGNAVRPWAEAGFPCLCYDLQHETIRTEGNITFMPWDALDAGGVPSVLRDATAGASFIFAFPPCTHLAISGARWYKGKGLRALAESINMFATTVEICEALQAPYYIENPVSTIATYWRKPDFSFQPHEYTGFHAGDNYSKKTCLWVGSGFVMPIGEAAADQGPADTRILDAPDAIGRANFRSATPIGFAQAVFHANAGRHGVREF